MIRNLSKSISQLPCIIAIATLPMVCSCHPKGNVSYIQSQSSAGWACSWGGQSRATQLDDVGRAVQVDAEGNVYVAGWFTATVDFDPGEGIDSHTANGERDIFLCKFNSSGTFQWARSWGGEGHLNIANGMKSDFSNNIYVVGTFHGSTDFDPGPGAEIHESSEESDAFLAKFDSTGQFIWVQTWDTATLFCLDTDSSGNVVVTGAFENEIDGIQEPVDLNPGPESSEHVSKGAPDAFIAKLGSDGDFHWMATWGGVGKDNGYGIVVDSQDSVLVTGSFEDRVDFDPGPGTQEYASTSYSNVYLSKFDSRGAFQWCRTWGARQPNGIAVDQLDNIYVAGGYSGDVDFDPDPAAEVRYAQSSSGLYLSKFSSAGDFLWVRTFGIGGGMCTSIAVNKSGDAYVAGLFGQVGGFDPGSGSREFQPNGPADAFLSKFSSSGEFLWALHWGGSGSDRCAAVISADESVFVTGWFQDTVDFDPGPSVDMLTSNGGTDAFLIVIPADGNW